MNFANLFSNINPKEVLKNLPDSVFVVEPDGKISWVNERATIVFETKQSILLDSGFDDIVANGTALIEKSVLKKSSVVTAAFKSSAKEFFVELNARKYVDQYFVTVRDVTAMTNVLAIAEKTGRLNKEKNTMLIKLSNEFKSPLQSITGFSQALLDGLGGDITEKQSKYVKIINKNSNDLLYFMEKFLDFAQAENSSFVYNYQVFDVINTIQNIIKNSEPQLFAKNLLINFDYEELEKRAINSDENVLKIILQNLLEISIRLTDIGAITVKVYNPDLNIVQKCGLKVDENTFNSSYIMFSVSDTGIGLSEAELEGLFEPYTQLDKVNRKSIVRSLCLGTVLALVKRLNGAIWVESEVMKGSAFNVILPIEKDDKIGNE